MSPLEAATIEELVGELNKRATATVICQLRPHPGKPDSTVYVVWNDGSIITCIGLAHYARTTLTAEAAAADDLEEEEADGN